MLKDLHEENSTSAEPHTVSQTDIWNKLGISFDYPDDVRCNNVGEGEAPPSKGFPILWQRLP